MGKVRLTYIISNINKALAFEWVALKLDKSKFELNFILLNPEDSELEHFLIRNNITVHRITYRGKKDLISALFKCCFYLLKWKTGVVHTHLFDANVVGLLSAKIVGVKKRIHTRHHSSLHHQYFPRAVFYDKCINGLSTNIIAITEMVKNILLEQENVSDKKVEVINHGFDLSLFQNPSNTSILKLKEKYKKTNGKLVVGVIARYTEWKGIQYIIPAFKKALIKYPNAHLVLANAQGDYEQEIKSMLKQLPNETYTEIKFENDIASLYQLFDIYVHTPIDNHSEAFGQTYVEALASEIPSIFTLSGVASEFIKDGENALVVNYKDSEDVYSKLVDLLNNEELKLKLIKQGTEDIKRFSLPIYINKLESLYLGK